ncbi:molybdopterin molybdotransferase MoeA [Pseudonocardia sp. DSM 110487]|uniref:molybdopterin molybdotransferase MoeA n=1 Tax=Pseudonocardia sp. DSM 110487 TaxID=2865833 RepID=UPI001C696129|nr:molybdopterin molybdotransferase MoeA [Pseudonocardia sp. DSM 110487]QYN37994.1 molybdopterin molybdotransferase MoeA [Pseudonocardia sp. DSM 110487]
MTSADVRHAAARTGTLAWDAAREVAHAAATPLPPREVALADADGTVLAAPLVAVADHPPVPRSAMDGYAVCGAPPWRVLTPELRQSHFHASTLPESGFAETTWLGSLAEGEACAVVTGAPLPARTTAVLADEDAVRDGDLLSGAAPPGRHIRPVAEECAAGEQVLPAGSLVTPAALGLAAALGYDSLLVRPLPRVVALVTGNELVSGGRPGPGQVRDAIGPMLPGLLARAGARPAEPLAVPDDRGLLRAALGAAAGMPVHGDVGPALGAPGVPVGAGEPADMVLVSGSSAAGPADHLRATLTELGAELLVDGVRCRPGHPQALARLGDTLVVGLPGNPLAALAAFLTVAVPALAGLRGEPLPGLMAVPIPGGIARHPLHTRLVPVAVDPSGAVPVGHAGSAMLRGAAAADAFAVVDPGPADAIAARLLPLDPGARPWAV